MSFELTIKNYRCFPDSHPVRVSFEKGFTAFVGANNSGKSSVLRFLYEFRPLFQRIRLNEAPLDAALRGIQGFDKVESILDIPELFSNSNGRDLTIEIAFPAETTPTGPCPELLVIRVPRGSNQWTVQFKVGGQMYSKDVNVAGSELRRGNTTLADVSCVFRAFQVLHDTLYIGPFRNALNVGSNDAYFDIKVGQAFIKEWRQRKTGNVVSQNEAIYRLTRDIERIFDLKRLEIDASSDEKTLQLFIEGKSFKLPTVGSGLTQFILVLANAAVRKPSYILIDEPELNLHPSLQLDFLTTLASYANEGTIFATHSIGLARAAGQKIYSFRRISEGTSEVKPIESTPRLSEFLGELSFGGYRELGFDKVLLVEGTTDVLTVQQFLRHLGKDHTVVLLPMGGSQMINGQVEPHLQELKRISQNIFALIDSEKTTANEALAVPRQQFVEACKKTGVQCHVLERRAMEHYLSDTAVKAVKGEKYRALTAYENRESAPLHWAKSENWLIARKMQFSDWKDTDLGEFLSKI